MEIRSFIKGSVEALHSEKGYLTLEEYHSIGRKRAPNFPADRSEVYALFRVYQRMKSTLGMFDEADIDTACVKYAWLSGTNGYVVAMASRAISLLVAMMEELQVEGFIREDDAQHADTLKVTSSCSAWQRMQILMDRVPLVNILLVQFANLYRT
ncbi:predicted protein, partial [Nematostella vectensis]